MARLRVSEYIARRVRWLRVRKFTVTVATLIEPGVESLVCSAYGAFGLTTLPWCHSALGIPRTWAVFWTLWVSNVLLWFVVDYVVFRWLQSGATVEVDAETPLFAKPLGRTSRRPFGEWLLAWVGRELLALPIWTLAVWGGVTVVWRGRKFWVGVDMKVHEIAEEGEGKVGNGSVGARDLKARRD